MFIVKITMSRKTLLVQQGWTPWVEPGVLHFADPLSMDCYRWTWFMDYLNRLPQMDHPEICCKHKCSDARTPTKDAIDLTTNTILWNTCDVTDSIPNWTFDTILENEKRGLRGRILASCPLAVYTRVVEVFVVLRVAILYHTCWPKLSEASRHNFCLILIFPYIFNTQNIFHPGNKRKTYSNPIACDKGPDVKVEKFWGLGIIATVPLFTDNLLLGSISTALSCLIVN